MINEEGAIVPEQFRMVEMFDRIDCLGKAVLGLTMQCAQCHTHKFDPLTQDEYYGLFAFLNNTYEAQSWVYTAEQRSRSRRSTSGIAALEDAAARRARRTGSRSWRPGRTSARKPERAVGRRSTPIELGQHQRAESSDAGGGQLAS